MELEELKTQWEAMSADLDKQKKLTDSLILKMTKMTYTKKLNKIVIPELAASPICLGAMFYILFNFQNLNQWYLVVCGVITVILLGLMPILSLRVLYGMQSINIERNSYQQSLMEYSKHKAAFLSFQKLSFYLNSLLLVVVLPVAGSIFSGKDLFTAARLWLWYALLFPFLFYFARWVYRHYNRATNDIENMLKELQD